MDAERRWGDPLDVNDGFGELNFQRSDRHDRSRFKIASVRGEDNLSKCIEVKDSFIRSNDEAVRYSDEETTFPNVSRPRQQCLKNSFNTCFQFMRSYIHKPYAPITDEENEIGKQYLDTEYPIYSHAFKHAPIVWVGHQLNVLDLLGFKLLCFYSTSTQSIPNPSIQPNNRSRSYAVSTPLNLMGKYVMICCVFVPSIWSSADARIIYQTSLASHELARRGDFAVVVVPMMRNGFTHSFSAYEHFFSGFSCLAVPFGEYLRREYICSVLGFDGQPKALILDPSQRVLYHGQPEMFTRVGGAGGGAFPFTPDRVDAYLCHERGWHDHYSLNELLGLRDTDVLYNIGYYHVGGDRLEEEEDGRHGITISKLKRKFVGIYVCFDGSSLYELEEVYKECCKRGKECELEIVVVGVPFVGMEHPKLMEKFMIEALESVKLLGRWFLPFNNTVSHRLCRMRCDSQEDGLFMVDHVRKYVDVYGFPVMNDFGGVDAYPFNRRNLIEKEFERKMGLRLKSLLLSCWEQHVIKRLISNMDEEVPLAQVLEKMPFVVLYMYKGGKVFEKNKIKNGGGMRLVINWRHGIRMKLRERGIHQVWWWLR
ncbi:hypothetical protein DM860_015050 [Cuscuta australis]|uniref:Uncharacterized protein n=1 Tax=Cuscuta australis TaxID=267555 RepID=A0A328DXD3_9ASTE|nr:hypothetical protein DM860_015050 [Cuscuta australis]